MAFHFRPTLGQTAELIPLQNAISHWGEIWTARPPPGNRTAFGTPSSETVSFPQQHEMWKRLGFMKHAHEFWMLSRIMVERFALSPGPVVLASYNGGALASPESDHKKGRRDSTLEVLDRYDQNDMDHLRITILKAINSSSSSNR